MVFLDSTHLLVLTKTGIVYHVDTAQPGTNVPVLSLSVNTNGENGLLGIARSPQFEKTGRLFLYYHPSPGLKGMVVSYRWNGTALVEDQHILSVPSNAFGVHYGGILLFGPDEKLYVVLGDKNSQSQTSNYENALFEENAVILRINEDGSAPIDNPFSGTGWEKIYAYGIRNSFGLAFDPLTGDLWDTENGPSTYDEINRVVPGMNSGWIDIMGPDSRDPQGVADLVMIPGAIYVDPAFSWLTTVAPTAIRFLDSCRWPASLRNDCFVAEFNDGNLYRFDLNADRTGFALTGSLSDTVADPSDNLDQIRWGTNFLVPTDIQVGLDGYLYVLRYGSYVYRIRPINPMGDLNLDESITMDDVPLFTSALLGETITPQELAVADFDGDGSVTGMDIPCFVTSLQMPN